MHNIRGVRLHPQSTRVYVPNGADVTLAQTPESGCGLESESITIEYRQVGPVRFYAQITTLNQGTSSPKAELLRQYSQKSAGFSVSVNPARVKLQEGGRKLAAKQLSYRTFL